MARWSDIAKRRERKRKVWRVVCWLTIAVAFVVIGSQHADIYGHLDDFGQGWRLLAWALSMGSAMWLAVDYQHNNYRDADRQCTYCGEKS